MATDEGFTYAKSSQILKTYITSTTKVGLSTTTPSKNGTGFTEPTGNGYVRGKFGTVNTEVDAQVSNSEIIFFFVALGDIGSVTHLGLFDSTATTSTAPFLLAKLTNPLTINENYVPLIREGKLVITLDKD